MFITFEGSEGSGKSTQIALLAHYLREQGFDVLETREPGGTAIGEQIRQTLHDVENTAMTAEAEILLYSASRAQLVGELIRPALREGKIVLCDRFADSTMAYQGYGRGLSLEYLAKITEFATGGLEPDITLLLDIEAVQGLKRRKMGALEMNRMDLQAREFYDRVREGYRQLITHSPERWVVIDGGRSIEAIQREIRRVVMGRMVYSE